MVVETRPHRVDVGIASVVGGGASSERDGEIGAAHMVEHLWFGTRQGDASVGNALAGLGADSNAFTSHDEVAYLTVAHRRTIRGLLELEAQRIDNPIPDATLETIEAEKAVVIAELYERYDGASHWYSEFLGQLVPGEFGYHRGVSGVAADVEALTPEGLNAYAERIYRPSNTAITVVGDFTPKQLIKLVKQTFPVEYLADPNDPERIGPYNCALRPIPKSTPALPPAGDRWAAIDADVSERTAVFGWTLPPGQQWLYVGDLLATLLESQIAHVAGAMPTCFATEHARITSLVCLMPLDEASEGAVEKIDAAIRKMGGFWRGLGEGTTFRQQRLNAASEYYVERWRLADFVAAERISSSSGGYLGRLALQFARSNASRMWSRGENARSVASAGAQLLVHDRMRTATLVPTSEQRPYAGQRHAGRIADVALVRDPDLTDAAYLERYIVAPDTSTIRIGRHQNDMKTWFWPVPGLREPRVALALSHPVLRDEPMLAHSTFVWFKDPEDVAARAVGVEIFQGGRNFSKSNRGDTWLIHASHAQPRWAASSLAKILIGPVLVTSRKDWKRAWGEFEQNRSAALEQVETRMEIERRRVFAPHLPIGLFDDDVFAEAKSVSRGEARETLRRILRPQHADLLIVGGRDDPRELLDFAEEAFKPWARKGEDARPLSTDEVQAASHPDRTVLLFAPDRPRSQAEITVACHTAGTDPTSAWLLESYISGALNAQLRGERALTYGVHAASQRTAHGPTLYIQTQVAQDTAGEALAAIFDALAGASDPGVAPDRLAQLKVEAARSTVGRYQTGDELLSLLLHIATSERGDERRSLAEQLADATPTSLAAEVADCVGHEVVTILGDPAKVGDALKGAGIPYVK